MKYRIIESEDSDRLESLVNQAMADGWIPQGGVCAVRYQYESHGDTQSAWWYSQAMVVLRGVTP